MGASAIMIGMSAGSLQTIPAFLAATVVQRGDEQALGVIRDGTLQWKTWRGIAEDVGRLATAIRAAGVEPGDRVAQVSENRYEWIVTDLAIHLSGAVHVPIHVTLSGQQIAEQIVDSGARLVFVSRGELLAKFAGHLASETTIWLYDEQGEGGEKALLGKPAMASPASIPPPPAPDNLATILYTSGTTGRPRGVMLSQRNLASNAAAVTEAHGGDADQTRLCFLPLSHIYARTCDLYTWVYRGWRLVLAESRDTLVRDCQLAEPTAMSAVPFVYQRIAEKVQASQPSDAAAALRAVFGGKMQRPSCGGAPLAAHVEAWYADRGLPVLPGYGLTETSPVVAMSTTESRRPGSVGRLLPNVEARIADDGEILVRGPNVMLGYWRNDAATAEMIRDGWLHTGDLGAVDEDGFLHIQGRKKELIVLSTGKKVFPSRVEALLAASPLVEQAAVFGEGCPALVALIVPARSEERDTSSESIEAEIAQCLATAAREEQVRGFALLDRPFSIDRGEMTAKLSLCRSVIARNFAAELDAAIASPRRRDDHNERIGAV